MHATRDSALDVRLHDYETDIAERLDDLTFEFGDDSTRC
jgi:hypothetical protein